MKITIDNKQIEVDGGMTIVAAAKQAGIFIPTLCHDEKLKPFASCGICMVEIKGQVRLSRACSTVCTNGMVIETDTPRVLAVRKSTLELMLSDHCGDCMPPCQLECPAETNCQKYVGLIAKGEFEKAAQTIKEKLPLPSSIGRVCPHPCETACRRVLVEEPIAIAALKSFAADKFLGVKESAGKGTGKSVGIIGGGPAGLTAAYFLLKAGHAVTIYEAQKELGGMLRYGIPEYRLPKKVLAAEIEAIVSMGATVKTDMKVGKDISLEIIRKNHNAVLVASGAWNAMPLRCKGEELPQVIKGTDFLFAVNSGKKVKVGKKVAVVGGGNVAMDACRTAVRLGAIEVTVIYRRSREEMPAEKIEIQEAIEEGVIFKFLTNPIEIKAEEKGLLVHLQKMQLGAPDSSGRRAPVPVEGIKEALSVDNLIIAVGNKFDMTGFEDLELTKWNTIKADEATFSTNLTGVFAVGDATNSGADIAIKAIGEAQRAAVVLDNFLQGKPLALSKKILSKDEKKAEDFAAEKKKPRIKMRHLPSKLRKTNFEEVALPLDEKKVMQEANRCLDCGCHALSNCKLIDFANRYGALPDKYSGTKNRTQIKNEHPQIHRDANKCIKCGLCVRHCEEVEKISALGFVDRGFATTIAPAMNMPLKKTSCIACLECVELCPTGALMRK